MTRPLRSWARWRLNLVIAIGRPRGLVAEAWIELHQRTVEEAEAAARAESNIESGPWPVCMPKGMH